MSAAAVPDVTVVRLEASSFPAVFVALPFQSVVALTLMQVLASQSPFAFKAMCLAKIALPAV